MKDNVSIEEALADSLARQSAGEPVAAIVADYPQHADELKKLLTAARMVGDVPKPPAFATARAAGLEKMLAAVDAQPATSRQPAGFWQRFNWRRWAVGSGFAAALGALFLMLVVALSPDPALEPSVDDATATATATPTVIATETPPVATAPPTSTPVPVTNTPAGNISEWPGPPNITPTPWAFNTEFLSVSNIYPARDEPIDVQFGGVWDNSCVPFLVSYNTEPDRGYLYIDIMTPTDRDDCVAGEFAWGGMLTLPPQPAGNWVIELRLTDSGVTERFAGLTIYIAPPGATPTALPTGTPGTPLPPTRTPSPTFIPTATGTPTSVPTATPFDVTETPVPTVPPGETPAPPSVTPPPTETPAPNPTATPIPTMTPTLGPTVTPTSTPLPTMTPWETPTPNLTMTATPGDPPTLTPPPPTWTPTPPPTSTPLPTMTPPVPSPTP